jgi:hypothetical protein
MTVSHAGSRDQGSAKNTDCGLKPKRWGKAKIVVFSVGMIAAFQGWNWLGFADWQISFGSLGIGWLLCGVFGPEMGVGDD